ncbi:MAG: hypothetical protein K1X94_31295 [Sandaracinaceae bacterium]|nr:hypothetical protein [Sandaracinaceae bacterium]
MIDSFMVAWLPKAMFVPPANRARSAADLLDFSLAWRPVACRGPLPK